MSSPRGNLPISTYVNPLYKAKEEKRDETAQQPEETKLGAIVPAKERAEFVPRKYKSITPRASGATTERKPQNITVIPARPEKIKGGLTKIDPLSFLPKIPGVVSPRGKLESSESSKIRPNNIAPGTIDKESSGEASKTESSEEQHIQVTKPPNFTTEELKSRIPNKKLPLLPIAERKPSGFKRVKPTSKHRSDLSKVISPREKKNFPESVDSRKAPSDDADFQESNRKAPKALLLRSERTSELQERVRASNLPRAITQRGDRPDMRTLRPRDVQGESRQEFPPLPNIALHSLSNELPLAEQGNQPIDEEIPRTAPRPAEVESSKSSQDIDETSTISAEPLALQPDSVFFDDENKETASSIDDGVLPENPSDQTGEDPREGLRLQRIQRDLANPGLNKMKRGEGASQITPLTGVAPNSSKKLARVVRLLILNNPSSSVSDTVRALNMIQCAVAGERPVADPERPETMDCAVKLSNLLPYEKYDYLQALFDQLKPYLLETQRLLIDRYLDSLKLKALDPSGTDFVMTMLKTYLQEEIPRTIIGNMAETMAETVYQAIKDDEDDRSKNFRAMNMVFCAAGGTVQTVLPRSGLPLIEKMPLIPTIGRFPEADMYALKLIDTPDESRYEYVRALFDRLSPYLTDSQRRLVKNSLDKIKNILNNPKLVKQEFHQLRIDLRADYFN